MASQEKLKLKKSNEPAESTAFSTLIKEVLDAELQNIIHDAVLEAHRQFQSEKFARPPKPPKAAGDEPAEERPDAAEELPICPSCLLPRLLYPTTGAGSRPPPDPTLSYCANAPPISKAGHDVNGNPFATDKPPYKSKMKKSAKQEQAAAAAASAASPASSQNSAGSPPVSPINGSFNSSAKDSQPPTSSAADEKKGVIISFPERKCPNCPRYLVVTKMARHLDRCLGISGRISSRNAMDKMGNGSGTGNTPVGSRAGTPSATATATSAVNNKKRAAVDEEIFNKKKKIKLNSPKKKESATGKEKKGSGLKNEETLEDTVVAKKKED